jgi:Flp pilus assembly protein TadD
MISASPLALKELLDRGIELHRSGRREDAAALYRLAADAGAGAPAHDLLGAVAIEQARFDEASAHLRRAIAYEPSLASALGHRGSALTEQGRPAEAIGAFHRALAVSGDDPLWLRNLGLASLALGDQDGARLALMAAWSLAPANATLLNDLGLLDIEKNQVGHGCRMFRSAIAVTPSLPEALVNLGLVELELADTAAARRFLRRARSVASNSPDVLNALAATDLAEDRPQTAAPGLRDALMLRPSFCEAHYNLGLAAFDLGGFDDADIRFRRSLAVKPGYAEAEWNLSLVELLNGNYRRGWRDYEARWRMRRFPTPLRRFAAPPWQGEDLGGCRILLHAEQGLGDTLQFIRYAPLVAARGGKVVVECQPQLRRLVDLMPSVAETCVQGAPLPQFDRYAPLLSLPRLFGTTLETTPRSIPYLTTGAADSRPSSSTPTTIGFVWAGSPSHRRDRVRSLPANTARELALRLGRDTGCEVTSFQLGPRAGELADMLRTAIDPAGDFLDTARVLEKAAALVTVDTALAHLAGALGLPTVVLLPTVPDFRWLRDRPDSPWYPSLHLVRQRDRDDWLSTFSSLLAVTSRLLDRENK